MEPFFIAGCGDIGRRVAQKARQRGAEVAALSRSEEQAQDLRLRGVSAIVAELGVGTPLPQLPCEGRTVFYFVPPPGGGYGDRRAEEFCAAMERGEPPTRLVYLSTSGVYGDVGDLPVDESMAPHPQTARARRRLHAEETFRGWGRRHGVPVVILRVTNIYGPGRLPIAHLTSGHPLLAEADSRPTCRIHSEDLAEVCLAVAAGSGDDQVFNLCDHEPCSATRYFTLVAEMLGIPCPPQISLEEARQVMKPLLFSYFTEHRMMNNKKIMNVPGVKLRYPTLREGIAASLIAEDPQA